MTFSITEQELSDKAEILVRAALQKQSILRDKTTGHRWDGGLRQFVWNLAAEIKNPEFKLDTQDKIATYLANELLEAEKSTELSEIKKTEAGIAIEAVAEVLGVGEQTLVEYGRLKRQQNSERSVT